jgi:predicted RNA binding protein YcfA (HicA-like mRNA interferase family)
MNKRKLLTKALNGTKSLRFADVVTLVKAFGFRLSRVKGSHHIFVHSKVRELVNLQDVGGKAKPYQVRQLLEIVERYNLQLDAGEES